MKIQRYLGLALLALSAIVGAGCGGGGQASDDPAAAARTQSVKATVASTSILSNAGTWEGGTSVSASNPVTYKSDGYIHIPKPTNTEPYAAAKQIYAQTLVAGTTYTLAADGTAGARVQLSLVDAKWNEVQTAVTATAGSAAVSFVAGANIANIMAIVFSAPSPSSESIIKFSLTAATVSAPNLLANNVGWLAGDNTPNSYVVYGSDGYLNLGATADHNGAQYFYTQALVAGQRYALTAQGTALVHVKLDFLDSGWAVVGMQKLATATSGPIYFVAPPNVGVIKAQIDWPASTQAKIKFSLSQTTVPDDSVYATIAPTSLPAATVCTDTTRFKSAAACQLTLALGRGINLGGLDVNQTVTAPIPSSVLDAIAKAGFQHVRLIVRWDPHASLDANATIKWPSSSGNASYQGAFGAPDEVIDGLISRGLKVILDMHHNDPLTDKNSAYERGRAVKMWAQISDHYKAYSTSMLYFELLNEPRYAIGGGGWNTLYPLLLAEVRKVSGNKQRGVLIGPSYWNNPEALATGSDGDNAPFDASGMDDYSILTVHAYAPHDFTLQGTYGQGNGEPWTVLTCCDTAQTATITTKLDLALTWAKTKKLPVYVGEFGSSYWTRQDARANHAGVERAEIEKRGFTWGYFGFGGDFPAYETGLGWIRPLVCNLESIPLGTQCNAKAL